MIAKSSNPLSPDVTIRFNNMEVDYGSVVSFSLSLEENKHDTCTITMRGIHPKAITDFIDTPVRVMVSSGELRKQEFCGYVLYVEPVSETREGLVNGSPFQTARIVCFGATVVMKGADTKVWENTSIGVLSQYMANTYGFSLDTPYDTFAFPRQVQKAESDWAFLTRVASAYGYRVTVHGTHMHVWDQTKSLGRKASFNVLTTMRKQMDAAPGMILRFEGSFGYLTPDGDATTYRTTTLDPSGKSLTVTSKDIPNISISGYPSDAEYSDTAFRPSQSTEEARRFIDEKNKGGFPFNAWVDVTAGAGIVPGGVVYIDEYNSNFDGIWYVKSVTHEVGGSMYITKLEIGRDFTLGTEYQVPLVEPFATPPAPRFLNNVWTSSLPRVNKYV
jgi:hypothetical protein